MIPMLIGLLIAMANGITIPTECWYIFGVWTWVRLMIGWLKVAQKAQKGGGNG